MIQELEKEIHLRDYLKVIRKRKEIVLTFFVITFTIVLLRTLTAIPMYVASTNLLVEKSESSNLIYRSAYNGLDPEFQATQLQIITSQGVAKRVVKTLKLDTENAKFFFKQEKPINTFIQTKNNILAFFKSTLKKLLNNTRSAEQISDVIQNNKQSKSTDLSTYIEENTKADTIADIIRSGISVRPVNESRVLTISYMHHNPVIAQMIVNAIADAYISEVLEIRTYNSTIAIKWMTQKSHEERARVEQSERKLQQYLKNADIVTLENRITVLPEKLSKLSQELASAIAKRNTYQARHEKILSLANNPDDLETLPSVSSNQYIQQISSYILTSESKLNELSKKYLSKHPKIRQAKQELQSLKDEKKKEISKILISLKTNYELAESQVASLKKLVDETKKEAQVINDSFVNYNILKREAETNQTLYQALLAQIKERTVTEDTNTINVWVTAKAQTPQSPAKPNKKRNLMLGLILGAFGGIGMAFFLEYLDNTVHSPEDLESRTGISVFGMIDYIQDASQALTDKMMLTGKSTPFAEGIKAARTAVLLSSAANPPKKIMITSTTPQEGKTTISINLARSFALAGNKVIIIDADLRKPRIHKVFGMENNQGLSSYLAGIDDHHVQRIDGEENLFVMPSGPIPPNPSELLVSQNFNTLMETLENEFDYIFIDSAPLFSATETLLISQTAKTLLVVKAESTTYDHIDESINMLEDAGSPPLGFVLNMVNIKQSGYGYGYGSYNYYAYSGYGQDSDEA